MGGIFGGLLVIAGDRLMPQKFSSAHMSHIPVLDFQILRSSSRDCEVVKNTGFCFGAFLCLKSEGF